MKHRYTLEEIQFIKDNVPGRSCAELAEIFNRRFKTHVTKRAINMFFFNHKIRNHNYNPPQQIGTEKTQKGYLKIKVSTNVWREKHILVWEAANGQIPKGHVVLFADRNKSNMNLDNLLLVSRRELAVMDKKHLIFSDAEKTKCGLLIAKIIILANDRTGKTRKHGKKRGER
jgi:hypothetical protein